MLPRTSETLATGRFACFACGAWGYLAEARQRWREEQQRHNAARRPPAREHRPLSQRPQQQWRALARQAALRGKRVAGLSPQAYAGLKDASAAWAAGVLAVGAAPMGG